MTSCKSKKSGIPYEVLSKNGMLFLTNPNTGAMEKIVFVADVDFGLSNDVAAVIDSRFKNSVKIAGDIKLSESGNILFNNEYGIRAENGYVQFKDESGSWANISSQAGGAPVGAQYLVLAADATLTNERVFTATTGLAIVDSGVGQAYTVSLDANNLTALGQTAANSDSVVIYDSAGTTTKKALVSNLPFTNNGGTVTSVGLAAGALIDVSGGPITTSGNITVNVDLSELTDGTASIVGSQDEMVYLDNGSQKRKQIDEIDLGQFNNDQNWSATTGTVTSVAIAGADGIDIDSGSPITGAGTITLGLSAIPNTSLANDGITIAGSDTSLGGTITADTIAAQISAGTITNAQLDNNTISGISLGNSLNALTISTGLSLDTGSTYDGQNTRTITNSGVTSIVGGAGISVDQATGTVTVTNTQSSTGGVVSHIMDSAGTVVLAGVDTLSTISWATAAASNSNVATYSNGVFTIASTGEYKATGFLVIEADTQSRSNVQIRFKFTNGASNNTDYSSITISTLTSSSVKVQLTSAYFNFTDINTREIRMEILADASQVNDNITIINDKGYPYGLIEITKLS